MLDTGTLRSLSATLVMAMAMISYGAPGTAQAADSSPKSSNPETRSNPKDMQLLLQARQFVSRDEILKRYNIGVLVRNRTATLYGALPSEALVIRAQECVRQVEGITDVLSRLRVDPTMQSPEGTPAPRTMPQALVPMQTPTYDPALMKVPDHPGFLGILGTAPASRPKDIPFSLVVPPPVPATESATERQPAPAVLSSGQGPAAMLLTPVLVDRSSGARESVERMSRSTERFRRLNVEIVGSTVWLRGTVSQSADLFALAEGVSKIPGIERVVVENMHRDIPGRP